MTPSPEMLASTPFLYAAGVRDGKLLCGKRIRQAVDRFWRWIDQAEADGYYLDHNAGMKVINFFPTFLNHTVGKMAGQPFHLAPFQHFTMYNVFAWKRKADGLRRIRTVYDKRAKKNGKTAEMAGVGLYCLSFDKEMGAQVYVGATKEDQARLCWMQAEDFINSGVANPALKKMGFFTMQRVVGFTPTKAKMRPLGGDSKTQDGINAHLAIIDEYHAHATDGVKENLESSSVMRAQPIVWHITTAGTNVQSPCKRYEDSVIEVLEGRVEVPHLFVMIHDLEEGDDWEDENVWYKANPLLGQGLSIDRIREEYQNAKAQPSKIPNFKTKHLNMWVDAPTVWIPNEIWMKGKHELSEAEVLAKFQQYGSFGGVDLSSTTDLTAYVLVSNPDEYGDRYVVPYFFCPGDTVEKRSKEDRVPYRYWVDKNFIIATPGNVVDYNEVEKIIAGTHIEYKAERVEFDPHMASGILSNMMDAGVNVSKFGQGITIMSAPTKEFERLVLSERIRHDGNPVLAWMLAGCQIWYDANSNMKVHKGNSNVNGRRIDGIVALIMALGGSMTGPDNSNQSAYNNPNEEIFI